MKKLSIFVILIFSAVSLLAGGKECNMKKASAKKVALTGTLSCAEMNGSNCEKTVFHVADTDRTYTVCEKTKAEVLSLGEGGKALHIKGKIVSCGEGEELMIDEASKI